MQQNKAENRMQINENTLLQNEEQRIIQQNKAEIDES
jgi:hypothetical protein